jgi:D-glycero-D-manno-heptose 1,7-bisphosphate phosphatase
MFYEGQKKRPFLPFPPHFQSYLGWFDLKSWAVFLDRDGVLNELVFYKDQGRVGSPLSAKQLRVMPNAGETVKALRKLGARVVVISNQPGVAKKQLSYRELIRMNQKIKKELTKNGARFDGEYYCLHHPRALLKKYRAVCVCRKPLPGLLLRAAEDLALDLSKSYFVGDSLVDVKAGKAAGTKTILVGTMTDLLNRAIEEEAAQPDFLISKFSDVPALIKKLIAR